MVNVFSSQACQIQKLGDENESLSNEIKELKETVAMIKDIPAQVHGIEKKNEDLTGTLTLQAKYITALINNVTKFEARVMTDQISRPLNDLEHEDTGNNIVKRVVLHSDTDILRLVTTQGTEIQKLQTDVAA